MGTFMKDHDIYIGSLLEDLNLRFAPSQGRATHFGGIEEMVALQKEFKIFKKGRSFKASCAALNLVSRNNEVKTLWFSLLANLERHPSAKKGEDGDSAIVNALVKNLAAAAPLPVYFTSHDMRGDKSNAEVKITTKSRPIYYIEQDYLTISLPMQPASSAKNPADKKTAR
jgi:mRNA-degrading endonuclease YafQ of YafQ-DinJ toxin-antitoxin module